MKILLNATTINVGGGLFVTVNFIKESLSNTIGGVDWYYLVSATVFDELKKISIILPKNKYVIISESPAKFIGRTRVLKEIQKVENDVKPDIVYSIGSPSYVKFKNIEVQRLTNPYITHPNDFALNSYKPFDKYKIILKNIIQRSIISKGKYFVTQSKTAKNGILKLTKGEENDVVVIPNSLSDDFKSINRKNLKPIENYIFCLAAPYPHKNIQEIPKIARLLLDRGINDFKIVVTIPYSHKLIKNFTRNCEILGVKDKILNVGKIKQVECKDWYLKAKVVFLPTYLETFSSTVLESLYLKVPLVTTNFSFNKDISGEFALYFDPENWNQAVDHLQTLLFNEDERKKILMSDKEFKNKFKNYSENYIETANFLKTVWVNKV